ncbi:MAG: hypothetical protein H8D22_05450 [Candidatus Cloacimonetes bacterium]|nr:hypothetical protein [Candidatus Cloacimonadota bacterium]
MADNCGTAFAIILIWLRLASPRRDQCFASLDSFLQIPILCSKSLFDSAQSAFYPVR